jgi:dihydroorotase
MYDLVLAGGRVLDPASGHDAVADVAFQDGRVAAIGDLAGAEASARRDVAGRLVTPGLIDLHTHVYWGGTALGVDPDAIARRSGCTTLVDAGSAGPANFHGFRAHVIAPAGVRVLPYLNVSFAGIFAFSGPVMVGENIDIRLVNARECVRVAREHADIVVGVKVRVGLVASGQSGVAPLDIALDAAEQLGLPVMAHLDYPPPSRREVIERLRPGDVLTHCFRPFPNAPARADGKIHEEVVAARDRGVVFDIGHGGGSFGFATARTMLAAGFAPDVISSDVHQLSIDGPAFDLLVTMSKFLALGMPLAEVIRAATLAPAEAIRRPELGRLQVGGPGDASVLETRPGWFRYADVLGEEILGEQKLVCRGIVRDGRWWHDGEA